MLKNIQNSNRFSLDNVCTVFVKDGPESELFCAELPATSNEFYRAAQLGIKPNAVLLVDSESYEGQDRARYNETVYSVFRHYSRSDGFTELYLTIKTGVR